MSLARCTHCGTRHVVKYCFTKIKWVFKEIGKTNVEVQRYICKLCGKTFQTDLERCSGYYVFDVEWIKINEEWKYHNTLLDSTSNCSIADTIYDTEDETTVEKFLRESTANKNKKATTTDLDKKYSSIIPKLDFKHQLCIFHTKKKV